MNASNAPWEDEPLKVGAVYGSFGMTHVRVLLWGGGHFDVYSDAIGDRDDYQHFSDGFIRQPYPQRPELEILQTVVVDAGAVRRRKPIRSPLDPLYGVPPFRSVATGLRCWNVGLRAGGRMWVMAHRWRRNWGRVIFEIETVGGREPAVLPVVSITTRSVAAIVCVVASSQVDIS